MFEFEVDSKFGSYCVRSASIISSNIFDLEAYSGVIIDRHIVNVYPELSNLICRIPTIQLDSNENSKEFSELHTVFAWMSEHKFNRSSNLLAIGGGVIQDIATFSSAVFHRGIRWDYIPTTALGQSDSCIGGKCGVNLSGIKNQIGLVYPPRNILIDTNLLTSLSVDDKISGLGEILKMSLTGQFEFWDEFKNQIQDFDKLDWELLVHRSLFAKKYVIEIDEMELDFRRILNYGHTFGHAIEAASNLEIPHGLGVLLGIKVANDLGVSWGLTEKFLADQVEKVINNLLAKTSKSLVFDVDTAIEKIKFDKKFQNGNAVFIILKDKGNLIILEKELNETLLNEIRQSFEKL